MNPTIDCLLTRRSVRKYLAKPVEMDKLDQILECGRYAATAKGLQGVHLVLVEDKALIARMSKMNAEVWGRDIDPFYGAPCVIVVLADPEACKCPVEDGSLALGNMMLAAHALGLGSCWINRAYEVFETEEGKAMLREMGLKDTLRGVGNLIVGYADGALPEPKPRRDGLITKIL